MWILLMLQVVTLLIEYSYFNRHVWKLAQSTNIQFCLTFGDSTDCSQPGSSLYEILHTRTLKWVAILFSRGSSQSRDRSHISCIASRFFTVWTTREDQQCYSIICQINMQMPISEKVILSFVYIFLMCTSPQFLYFYWIKNHREKKKSLFVFLIWNHAMNILFRFQLQCQAWWKSHSKPWFCSVLLLRDMMYFILFLTLVVPRCK